jgi:hypothetical protein
MSRPPTRQIGDLIDHRLELRRLHIGGIVFAHAPITGRTESRSQFGVLREEEDVIRKPIRVQIGGDEACVVGDEFGPAARLRETDDR